MTARITPIPAGMAGARYPWECKAHEHDRQAYYHEGQQVGPVARWLGAGVERLGFEQGGEVAKEDHLILFGELCDPRLYRELTEQAEAEIKDLGLMGDDAKDHYAELLEGARLGRAPRQYKSVEDRLAAALAKEPDADKFRRAEIRRQVEAKQPKSIGSFDLTFSPAKSISLYRAGLLAQGRTEDAGKVEAAHRAGVAAALEYLQREAGFSRAGYHGRSGPDQPSVGRYVDAHEWLAAEFLHETSREGDVQMHSHLQVLNRVPTVDESGQVVWRTLDSRGLHKARPGMEAVYHRTMEEQLTRDLPVDLETREDGKAREVIGVTVEDRDAASKRRQQVTGKVAEWVELYKERTGHEPSAQTLAKMTEKAALKTRSRKDPAQSMDDLVDRWERDAVAAQRRTHAEVVDNAEAAAVGRRLGRMREGAPAPVLDRGRVIAAALGEVESERTRFSRDDVMRSINRHLPEDLGAAAADAGSVTALLESLTDEALIGHGVIQVSGFELIEMPLELRRESDGRSIYQPGRSERYATVATLDAEERMVATASRTDAPRLSPGQIEDAIAASTLGEDQAEAVRGVLGDGRQVSVIVGPAGAGKSYAQGVITQAWEQAGGKVIGLAPSNIAAAVLNEAGVSITASVEKFFTHAVDGKGTLADQERYALRPGDLVIVDEAAMVRRVDMERLVQVVADAGAKMATVGDDGQMQSVGAGGSFRLLKENGAYELRTVRRFRNADGSVRQWEADASLQLRDGKVECLAAYEEHGRLHGGTEVEMADAAVAAYVASTLANRQAALTTPTNAVADDLSARIRAELVHLGLVEEGGAAIRGGNVAGVGDLVQTRENDSRLVDSEGQRVINRRMYRVTERHQDGSLTVRHVTGRDDTGEVLAGTVRLGPDYLVEWTALGYAGTVHATQGRNVGDGYLYGDDSVSREAAYVALTRGTELNEAFLVTSRGQDGPELRTVDSNPIEMMARIMERETTDRSATETLRDGLEWSESLPALAPIWSDLTAEHIREQSRALLADILGPDSLARLDAEHADPLYRHLRETQLQGHNVEALLREAIGDPRSLADARSLGALLQDRVEKAAAWRTPDREPVGPDWRDRTPETMQGPVGETARQVAEAMQARQEELGRRTAEEAPTWAVDRLGPLPEEQPDRAEWEERAGVVAAYREMYGADGEGTVIGQAPPRGAVDQRAAWDAAYEALGRPDEQRHIAAASDEQLRAMLARYEREQTWAPMYAGEQMAEAYQVGRDHERRATLAEAEAVTLEDPAARGELETYAAGLRGMAEGYAEQAAMYEEINAAHRIWRGDTEQVREDAQAAAAELERRLVDRQPPAERVADVDQAVTAPAAPEREDAAAERDQAQYAAEPERAGVGVEVEQDQAHEAPGASEPASADMREVHEPEPAVEVEPAAAAPAPSPAQLAAQAFPRPLAEELHTARLYLDRRAQREAAGREAAGERAAAQRAAREEQAHRDSARIMRDRQAQELSRSRGYER